jgi:hypothetical protein
MWTIELFTDPLDCSPQHHHVERALHSSLTSSSLIVSATIPIQTLFGNNDNNQTDASLSSHQQQSLFSTFAQGGRTSRVALADSVARYFLRCHGTHEIEVVGDITNNNNNNHMSDDDDGPLGDIRQLLTFRLETLDVALLNSRRQKKRLTKGGTLSFPPYVIERSDFWCCEEKLHVTVRGTRVSSSTEIMTTATEVISDMQDIRRMQWLVACQTILSNAFPINDPTFIHGLLHHTACVVLQHKIRTSLSSLSSQEHTNTVAFIANGSILPRKSSSSNAPMDSPPAVPFKAPTDSTMSQSISVDMGCLSKYLPPTSMISSTDSNSTIVTLTGLVVPGGVTLICGGGYHGKSTLLQTIAVGVYDKIPGDGREYCVTVHNAVSVRAEDGRYVNNCNISAFISNLPTPPGVDKALDTRQFSTRDASGSTSQAANVVEAIEMGATAMLVDEDIRCDVWGQTICRNNLKRVIDLFWFSGAYHTSLFLNSFSSSSSPSSDS